MRRELDAYYTPDALAEAILATYRGQNKSGRSCVWLEPSVGGGAFARAIKKFRPNDIVIGIDINPNAAGLKDVDHPIVGDFLSLKIGGPELIIGNPPFNNAEAHVRHAISLCSPGGSVAFLLRLAFLEGSNRRKFWDEFPPVGVNIIRPRPSFIGGGTDMCAYALFTWRSGHGAGSLDHSDCSEIGWIDWKKKSGSIRSGGELLSQSTLTQDPTG